jgi:hypothetical protein
VSNETGHTVSWDDIDAGEALLRAAGYDATALRHQWFAELCVCHQDLGIVFADTFTEWARDYIDSAPERAAQAAHDAAQDAGEFDAEDEAA